MEVANVTAVVEPMAQEGLTLYLETPDFPVTVISDQRRVEQVLLDRSIMQ